MLDYWNNSPRINIPPYSDTLSWFRANQSLAYLLNGVCLAKKQQIPIFIVFGLTRSRLEPTIYRTRSVHANHYTTNASNKSVVAPEHIWWRGKVTDLFLLYHFTWLSVLMDAVLYISILLCMVFHCVLKRCQCFYNYFT